MSRRDVSVPGFFIWATAGGVVALCFAVYAGIRAAERHSALLWTACVILVASALLTFSGAALERRRRARSRAADGSTTRVEGRGDG
ncbi:hypothetical protein ACRAWB_15090 [Leifsonia poae]|uniref:hypothetical protein n=1 Tax=Leifsonia poae TaxID=110933 RepID=UPI003D6967C2